MAVVTAVLLAAACSDDATDRAVESETIDPDLNDGDAQEPDSDDETTADGDADQDRANTDPVEGAAVTDEDADLDALATACENDDIDACRELLDAVGATTEDGRFALEQLSTHIQEREASRWPPRGFTEATPLLAVRTVGDPSCRFGRRCIQYEVVPREGCSGIYLEANLLDSDQRVIDWTNDSLGSLRAGDVGVLELTISDTRVTDVRMTEARCHP